MKEIEDLLKNPLKDIGLFVDEIKYVNKELRIVLDGDFAINVDKIVEATKIINKILDEKDLIKESYILDVSSKEKGVTKNE